MKYININSIVEIIDGKASLCYKIDENIILNGEIEKFI